MTLTADFFCRINTYESILCIEGADAETFLQGQTTCDVREVTHQQSRLGAICNPKGRALSSFRLIKWQDRYLMLLPTDLLPLILKRLRMFVLRAKVTLRDATEEWTVFGLSGSACPLFDTDSLNLPAHQIRTDAQSCRIRPTDTSDRILLITKTSEELAVCEKIKAQGIPEADPSLWHLFDIQDGLPHLGHETQEMFVPQMINLDLLQGISFKKGCYTGQEIVARMHYLGNLKKRMYRFTSKDACAPATRLFILPNDANSVGIVVDCEHHPDGHYEILAVCQIQMESATTIFPENSATFIERAPLPYVVNATA